MKPAVKKKVFVTKLSKFLFLILLLIIILVFTVPLLFRYLKAGDVSSRTKPSEPNAAKISPPQALNKKNTAGEKQIDHSKAFQKHSSKYTVEENANSSHLTAKLEELAKTDASEANSLKAVDEYLNHNVDPNQVVNNESPAFFAARNWNYKLLKKFGKIDFKVATTEGYTIMHVLCKIEPKNEEEKKRAIDALKYLISIGGEVDAVNKINGYSPLMYAVECRNFEFSLILLDNGAKPDGPADRNFDMTPLMLAIEKEQSKIARLLTERNADILAYNKTGTCALSLAAINGYVRGLRILLSSMKSKGFKNPQDIQVPSPDKDSNNSKEWEVGATLLHLAVMHNQLEIAQKLIMEYKADLTLKDKNNCIAEDHAIAAVNVYRKVVKEDPKKYAEALERAEKILKLFSIDEKGRTNYQEKTGVEGHNQIVTHANQMFIESQRKKKQEALEKLRAEGFTD